MALLIKEKNFIFIDDGSDKKYCYNINNGIFYGKNGKPRKTLPLSFNASCKLRSQYCGKDNLLYAFSYIMSKSNCAKDLETYKDIFSLIEYITLIRKDIRISLSSWNYDKEIDIDFIKKYFKQFASFIKKYDENITTNDDLRSIYRNFKAELILNIAINELHLPIEKNDDIESIIYTFMNFSLNKILYALKLWVKYGVIFSEDIYTFQHMIRKHYNACEKLNIPYEVKGDFFRNANEIYKELLIVKEKLDEEKLIELYSSYFLKISFENEKFIVIIPTKASHFREEASNQHNCVYTEYYPHLFNEKVSSLIVFIRKKDDISKSYITCEINIKTGKIIQFLEKYNQEPTEENIIQFKNDYQEFLTKNFKKSIDK